MTIDTTGLRNDSERPETLPTAEPAEMLSATPETSIATVQDVAPVASVQTDAAALIDEAPSALPLADAIPQAVADVEDDHNVSASDVDPHDYEDEPEAAHAAAEGGEPSAKPQAEPRRRSGYQRGEIIEVTVLEVNPTAVTVELDERGAGFVGLIPDRELSRLTPDQVETLQTGVKTKLYVVNTGDPKGNVILSLNRALEELDWQTAEDYRKSREVYNSTVAGYNKGGLIVRFGRLRGFVPQSQISEERRQRIGAEATESMWEGMVRETILIKVIEVDRARNRLILSERAATRESREGRKARLIDELTLNEVRKGRVVSLEDFGAFVDIGGAEGLIHLTELSWGHITHPKQVLKVGQEVTVEVISIDPDRKRIGLSLRRQLSDPWDVIASNYHQGQLVRAQITKLTKFGAFAQLVDEPDIEGLVHISELSDTRVAHPRDVVNIGEQLTLRVVKIDVAERRLGLSLKRVKSTEYLDSDMDHLFG